MIDVDLCCDVLAGVIQQSAAEQEQERADFLKLKQQLEIEFNQKRAKFKELYLSKEGDFELCSICYKDTKNLLDI